MGRVCRVKIEKPKIAFRLKGCKKRTSYYYISNYNERKKLTQFIIRLDDIVTDQSKVTVTKNDIVESKNLEDITFGKRGAILFSDEILNYYNEAVEEREIERNVAESNDGDESNDDDDLHINDLPQYDEIDHIKKYISRTFNVEQIVEITNCCSDRINRIKHLTEKTCINDMMNPPYVKSNQYTAERNASEKETGVKQKKRIQPTLVSKLNL